MSSVLLNLFGLFCGTMTIHEKKALLLQLLASTRLSLHASQGAWFISLLKRQTSWVWIPRGPRSCFSQHRIFLARGCPPCLTCAQVSSVSCGRRPTERGRGSQEPREPHWSQCTEWSPFSSREKCIGQIMGFWMKGWSGATFTWHTRWC